MTKQQYRRTSDIKDLLVKEIVASKPKSEILKTRKQIENYLRHYVVDVPVEDMEGRPTEIMAQAAIAHLQFGAVRKKRQALLRIFNPTIKKQGYESIYTIVEMVNDDMPFLVDSVSAAINRQGLAIHITVHPVLRVTRDGRGRIQDVLNESSGTNESFIRFNIDKATDEHVLKILEHEIYKVLGDVRAAVTDWAKLKGKMAEAITSLHNGPTGNDVALTKETEDLLKWMADDHFTFLGFREYKLQERSEKTYLRPVKGTGLGILRSDDRGGRTVELSKEMRRYTRSKDWLIITKANSRATVHRHSYLDYVGIKKYDDTGNAVGELRFLGLFTSAAYSESPRNIPLLRHKVKKLLPARASTQWAIVVRR